jgi:hypothetical protein
MRRAVTIVGRFAFGGLALVGGLAVAVCIVIGLIQRALNFDFLWVLFFGLFGLVGGVVVGVVAAVLDRLIKQPAGKAANEAASNNPGVWPPAPKAPQ